MLALLLCPQLAASRVPASGGPSRRPAGHWGAHSIGRSKRPTATKKSFAASAKGTVAFGVGGLLSGLASLPPALKKSYLVYVVDFIVIPTFFISLFFLTKQHRSIIVLFAFGQPELHQSIAFVGIFEISACVCINNLLQRKEPKIANT